MSERVRDWERIVAAQKLLQEHFPELVLVGPRADLRAGAGGADLRADPGSVVGPNDGAGRGR